MHLFSGNFHRISILSIWCAFFFLSHGIFAGVFDHLACKGRLAAHFHCYCSHCLQLPPGNCLSHRSSLMVPGWCLVQSCSNGSSFIMAIVWHYVVSSSWLEKLLCSKRWLVLSHHSQSVSVEAFVKHTHFIAFQITCFWHLTMGLCQFLSVFQDVLLRACSSERFSNAGPEFKRPMTYKSSGLDWKVWHLALLARSKRGTPDEAQTGIRFETHVLFDLRAIRTKHIVQHLNITIWDWQSVAISNIQDLQSCTLWSLILCQVEATRIAVWNSGLEKPSWNFEKRLEEHQGLESFSLHRRGCPRRHLQSHDRRALNGEVSKDPPA